MRFNLIVPAAGRAVVGDIDGRIDASASRDGGEPVHAILGYVSPNVEMVPFCPNPISFSLSTYKFG